MSIVTYPVIGSIIFQIVNDTFTGEYLFNSNITADLIIVIVMGLFGKLYTYLTVRFYLAHFFTLVFNVFALFTFPWVLNNIPINYEKHKELLRKNLVNSLKDYKNYDSRSQAQNRRIARKMLPIFKLPESDQSYLKLTDKLQPKLSKDQKFSEKFCSEDNALFILFKNRGLWTNVSVWSIFGLWMMLGLNFGLSAPNQLIFMNNPICMNNFELGTVSVIGQICSCFVFILGFYAMKGGSENDRIEFEKAQEEGDSNTHINDGNDEAPLLQRAVSTSSSNIMTRSTSPANKNEPSSIIWLFLYMTVIFKFGKFVIMAIATNKFYVYLYAIVDSVDMLGTLTRTLLSYCLTLNEYSSVLSLFYLLQVLVLLIFIIVVFTVYGMTSSSGGHILYMVFGIPIGVLLIIFAITTRVGFYKKSQ